ncbi:MAG: hypothetical protein GY765_42085 [bacterium]|nr:hypothetical protein [bacterium]
MKSKQNTNKVYKPSFNKICADARYKFDRAGTDSLAVDAGSRFGYTQERFREGENILEHTLEMEKQRSHEITARRQLTKDQFRLEQAAWRHFVEYAQVARVVLEDRTDFLEKLPRPYVLEDYYEGWTDDAIWLYETILEDRQLAETLFDFGIGQKELMQAGKEIGEYEATIQRRLASGRRIEEFLQAREAGVVKLQEWLGRYEKIMRIALRENERLLGRLGISAE